MPSYNSDIGISIPTEANRSAPLTAAYYLGKPLCAGSPMQLGVTLVGSDQQDFLNRLDLPIRRSFTRRSWRSVLGDNISMIRNGSLIACRPTSIGAQLTAISASK